MGLKDVGEKNLVFRVVSGCVCKGCCRKVKEKLKRYGTCSVHSDEREEKLTIQGGNVGSNTAIIELEEFNIKVELITEEIPTPDQIKKKQVIANEMKVENKASALVVYKSEACNQVVGTSDSSMVSCSHSELACEHKLELKEYDKRFTCNGCKEDGFKKGYRCRHCDYELHMDCMNPGPTVSHDLFKGSIFKFSREKPTCSILSRVYKCCEACGNEIQGYSYHCEAKDLYLHPSCVNFTGDLCIQGESFVLEKRSTSKCFWCNESNNRTNSGCSYVSKANNVQLHVNCLAKIAHEAWKERATGWDNDAYILVLKKRLNWELVKNKKSTKWSKFLKMVLVFARTIIGILLGDPTVILATTLVEAFLK